MCSVFGVITVPNARSGPLSGDIVNMLLGARERGRDGLGYLARPTQGGQVYERMVCNENSSLFIARAPETLLDKGQFTLIGNARAEPTTEYVKDKQISDQQPYALGGWSIVHNGTIANDKELRVLCEQKLTTQIDSAAIVEMLVREEHDQSNLVVGHKHQLFNVFHSVVKQLKGSYAILATHDLFPGVIFTACNYRPIWRMWTEDGHFFASAKVSLPYRKGTAEMIPPYTVAMFDTTRNPMVARNLREFKHNRKALVVCSGGMDSTVAACIAQSNGYKITLINFQYGCRAESNEITAVEKVAEKLGARLIKFPMNIYNPEDSPLFDPDAEIAGGEAGAEFAHEWVPARNLVMLSIATAYAEANGYDTLVLGNNLEEAGAYPDNEPEFINKFNALLPFAVGDGKQLKVIMPVGNMMKHEIVAEGLSHDAPLGDTWSCYRNGALHCGTCGPCMMRKVAFKINNAVDPIQYESDSNEA